jgi:general secretion pathway protein D
VPRVRSLVPALLAALVLAACGSIERLWAPPEPLAVPAPASQGAAAVRAGPPAGGQRLSGAPSPAGFVRPGSGTQLGPAPFFTGPATGGEFTLNFVDVDVAEVARVVLGDMLRVPFVVDPRVRGPVTVETAQGVPRAALLPTLSAALRTHGAGLVETPAGFEVVPLPDARRLASLGGRGGGGIVPISPRFAAAADLVRALQPFLGEEVAATVDAQRNVLVLSGDRRQVENLVQLVAVLDVDAMGGRSFALYPLRTASAGAVARELEGVFAGSAGVRFLPIQRQNSILAIANAPATLARVSQWVRDLDQAGGRDEVQVYVYQVEYGRATDLARVLGRLFGSGGETGAERMPPAERTVAPGLAASRLVGPPSLPGLGGGVPGAAMPGLGGGVPGSGGGLFGGQQQPGAAMPDGQDPAGGQRAAGTEPEPVPEMQLPGNDRGAPGPRIIADANSNTIVVQSTASDWGRIEAALRRLDQVPLQVLIEATIAEVTLNDQLRFGLQFALRSGNFSFNLTPQARAAGQPIGVPGVLGLVDAGAGANIALEALSSLTRVNVISSPQLMVVSNQTAQLQVGDQVPVATQSAVPLDQVANSRIVNSIQFRDTGVILRVTPRVNSSGLIGLDVEQEVSDVVPTTTSGIDSPTIRQRRVRSTVAVQSGETVALGGLIREQRNATRTGIPGLRDLPVVGPLFGLTDNSDGRTELLVLITPRIVRNSEEARAVTAELRGRLRGLQPASATPPQPRAR